MTMKVKVNGDRWKVKVKWGNNVTEEDIIVAGEEKEWKEAYEKKEDDKVWRVCEAHEIHLNSLVQSLLYLTHAHTKDTKEWKKEK